MPMQMKVIIYSVVLVIELRVSSGKKLFNLEFLECKVHGPIWEAEHGYHSPWLNKAFDFQGSAELYSEVILEVAGLVAANTSPVSSQTSLS